MADQIEPLILFVPAELGLEQREEWVAAILDELREKDLVQAGTEDVWRSMLVETATVGLHPIAVSQFLMVLPGAQPVYVWATVGEQPSGRPESLMESIAGEVVKPFGARKSRIQVDAVSVDVGLFMAREEQEGASDVVYLLGAVATSLTLEEIGEADVCLWFTGTELSELPAPLPALARFIRDPDMAAFLTL